MQCETLQGCKADATHIVYWGQASDPIAYSYPLCQDHAIELADCHTVNIGKGRTQTLRTMTKAQVTRIPAPARVAPQRYTRTLLAELASIG